MHIHKNPLLLGTLPADLEGGLDVFIPAVKLQGKADPTKNCLGVSGRRIIVSEKASIQRDSLPALALHYEAAKCRNGVGVEMNLRASQIVHDARQEFVGRESYPSSQLRFKAENGRALDGGDIYLRDERDQVTCQPSTVVVRPAIVFGHGHLPEEVGEF
jgi:hypothetical protein